MLPCLAYSVQYEYLAHTLHLIPAMALDDTNDSDTGLNKCGYLVFYRTSNVHGESSAPTGS